MSEDATTKLARALVEIPDSSTNPMIDTCTNIPTKEMLHLIADDRMKASNFGIPYFDLEADVLSETLRAYEDRARIYDTRALIGNPNEFGEQLGVLPDKKQKKGELNE